MSTTSAHDPMNPPPSQGVCYIMIGLWVMSFVFLVFSVITFEQGIGTSWIMLAGSSGILIASAAQAYARQLSNPLANWVLMVLGVCSAIVVYILIGLVVSL